MDSMNLTEAGFLKKAKFYHRTIWEKQSHLGRAGVIWKLSTIRKTTKIE